MLMFWMTWTSIWALNSEVELNPISHHIKPIPAHEQLIWEEPVFTTIYLYF